MNAINNQCIICKQHKVKEGTLCEQCTIIANPYDEEFWKLLKRRLRMFDRTYEFSDDHSVWRKWKAEEKSIERQIVEALDVDRERTILLVDKYNKGSEYGTKFTIEGKHEVLLK